MTYISDAVCRKDSGCGAALLGGTRYISHAYTNDKADYWSEESNHGVASYRCGSSMGPAASPNHCTASDDRQAAGD